MPDKVVFASGNEIQNLYDAGGRKLKSRYLTKVTGVSLPATKTTLSVVKPINTLLYTGSETNYIGNLEYETEVEIYSATMMLPTYNLARIYNPEGYVTTVTNPVYYYFRRDHLGNNREVCQAPPSGGWGAAVQRTQYYPSGLPWADGLNPAAQNKKYNGKEFIEAHGLDEYDSAARWYYPAILRTTTLDPLAEKYYSISPYAWCGNNPILLIDPDGRDITLSGHNTQTILDELQKRIGNNGITLTWNKDNGYMGYTVVNDKMIDSNAKELMNAIDDKVIQLNVIGVSGSTAPDGTKINGGAFMGNKVFKDNSGNITKVIATQVVNADFLKKTDAIPETPGKTTLHEVTEGYQGAKISQQSGIDAPKASIDESNNPNSVYNIAHKRASPQTPIQDNNDGTFSAPLPIKFPNMNINNINGYIWQIIK